jgi:hypothetical protein
LKKIKLKETKNKQLNETTIGKKRFFVIADHRIYYAHSDADSSRSNFSLYFLSFSFSNVFLFSAIDFIDLKLASAAKGMYPNDEKKKNFFLFFFLFFF